MRAVQHYLYSFCDISLQILEILDENSRRKMGGVKRGVKAGMARVCVAGKTV